MSRGKPLGVVWSLRKKRSRGAAGAFRVASRPGDRYLAMRVEDAMARAARSSLIRIVVGVATEELVGTFAREHDLHPSAGLAGEQIDRQAGGIPDRLVEGADRVVEHAEAGVEVEGEMVMVAAEGLGDGARACGLSSSSASWKPTENVAICPTRLAAAAATAEESIPPERKTPTGTSAINRLSTASAT
ncbi:MAG: hypothetical protein R3F16_17365 [Myxococcota bacterium]